MCCEIKRMLLGRKFLAAVLLCAATIFAGTKWPAFTELLETGQFLSLAQEALCSKIVCYLMPVTGVLPWSDSFLTEIKGGFLKSSLPRQNRRIYIENKILAVAFGGFLVWMFAGIIVLFVNFVICFPFEKQGALQARMFLGLAAVLSRCGLIAGILGTLGGICAVLSGSAYLAFGFPFVGYYFCMILQERYFPDALWLYPPQWISGSAWWGDRQEGLWMFLLLFLAVAMGIHGGTLMGKLEEL